MEPHYYRFEILKLFLDLHKPEVVEFVYADFMKKFPKQC